VEVRSLAFLVIKQAPRTTWWEGRRGGALGGREGRVAVYTFASHICSSVWLSSLGHACVIVTCFVDANIAVDSAY